MEPAAYYYLQIGGDGKLINTTARNIIEWHPVLKSALTVDPLELDIRRTSSL